MLKRVVSLAGIILLATSLFVFQLHTNLTRALTPSEPHNANAMWIEPSTVFIDRLVASIGDTFNITIWTNTSVQTQVWQFQLIYDKGLLNASRCGYTAGTKSEFFQNISTGSANPVLSAYNATHNLVRHGEWGHLESRVPGYGSLSWIEFEVMALPGAGGEMVASLDLASSGNTYILDPDLYRITLGIYNCEYRMMNPARGPRLDDLVIKYFNGTADLFNALKNGEVDLTDTKFTTEQTSHVFNDTNIQAAISPSSTIFEFDFNNNATTTTYPHWTNPTAYKGFRQGIAYLINKTYIVDEICNNSYRIDTPIPRPNGDWWVEEAVSQYDSHGNLLGNYPYEYNPTIAAYYFNQSGFLEGNTSNANYDPTFPSSAQHLRIHPETGEDLEPLIFYIRYDEPIRFDAGRRLEAGRILRDNLRKMGIPVNAIETNSTVCLDEVMQKGDYHIYTGGWALRPEYYNLLRYSREYITIAGTWMINYPQFRNTTYDELVSEVMYPSDLASARDAALRCQRILIQEAVCVWLWSPSIRMAYRDIHGVVNFRGEGIDNRWTFLTARRGINATQSAIYYGLQFPPYSLNVITGYGDYPDVLCLSRIYDTLLSFCPYDLSPGEGGGTMPWMASDWELGTWESPYNPLENLTRLTFRLREGIRWHDGVELTSDDVKFTIEYLKGLGQNASLYSSVSDVHHVTTPDAHTVIVYENISNIWTLDMIGTLPILPRHIFQNISDVLGYTPGVNKEYLANQTLIGSGPWKYVFHNDSMLYLEANRDYFMETPPEGEIDFRYDWQMGARVVDIFDVTMTAEAFGTTGDGVPSHKWEPGCDVAGGDCLINIADVVTVARDFNLTWGASARHYITPPPTDTSIIIEHTNPIVVGENLTVYLKLKNLEPLSGLQVKMNYDNTKLDCHEMNVNPILNHAVKEEVNQTKGLIWISLSSLGSGVATGNATLATITFNTTKPGGSIMNLWNTKLAYYGAPGSTCQPMLHEAFDRGVMVGIATPTGINVTVAPEENANVTFSETTTEGITTINITQPPSEEFTSVRVHDIETTANYTGPVTVTFQYLDIGLSLEDELNMKIWLWNDTSQTWLDITTSVDTENNIVEGIAPHLSMFGVTSDVRLEGNVIQDGETTIGTPAAPPPPLPGLEALAYLEIESTVHYDGPVSVGLTYNETFLTFLQEMSLQIWLWNETSEEWLDITLLLDVENNVIKGLAPHLSMFGVTSVPASPGGITVVDASCSKTVVGQGFSLTVDFTIVNLGDFTENFDAMVYCNSAPLVMYPDITLAPGDHASWSYLWNTTGWPKDTYAVTVFSQLVDWVTVAMVGDITGPEDGPDGVCNMRDVGLVARYFGQSVPPAPSNCDLTGPITGVADGIINMRDVGLVARHFGETDP